MADGLPESLVLLYVAGDAPAGSGAPAALDPAAATAPARQFLAGQEAKFLGPAALPAAPSRDPGPPVFSVGLTLNGEPANLTTDADRIGDQLIALYLSGGWDWANALLEAVSRRVVPLRTVGGGSLRGPGQIPAQHAELLRRAVEGVEVLKVAIEEAVAELAHAVLERARQQAARVRVALDRAQGRYGVRRKPRDPGGGASSGAEGGSGTSDTQGFEVHEAAEPGAAADLMERLRTLVAPYLELQRVLDLAKASPPETRAPGERPPPGAERSPYPGVPSSAELDAARRRYRAALEALAADHPIGPGVFALCVAGLLEQPDQPLDEQRMLAGVFEYFHLAEPRMVQLPQKYPEAVLRYVMKEPLPRMAGEPAGHVQDTPELRAMWWASRPENRSVFEPLLATRMIDAIRTELVQADALDDEELVRTTFMLAVIQSLGLSKRAADALRLAQVEKAERPYQRYDKTSALLSLISLVVPPLGAAAAAIAAFSLYGHCVNQFAALSALTSDAETRAVDALLSDDGVGFALAVGDRPGVADVLLDAAAPLAKDLALAWVLPLVAVALQARDDAKVLLE